MAAVKIYTIFIYLKKFIYIINDYNSLEIKI